MADSRVPNAATPYNLPPGAFFYPSGENLICYYLTSKNSDLPRYGVDLIQEIDLYNYDPFDLPETACFHYGKEGKKKHWYCYVGRVEAELQQRAAGIGYWKREGVKDVISATVGRVVGTRNRFVFYLANKKSSAAAARTGWVMYEYESIAHPQASFVLCRIFKKPDARNNLSDSESSDGSSGEEYEQSSCSSDESI